MNQSRRTVIAGAAGAALAAISVGEISAQAPTNLAGRKIVYEVAGYRIQMEFISEVQIRWTYLAAPTATEIGKTSTETCDRMDLRADLVLMAWTESDKTHVFDVFDFVNNIVFGNFVWPDGKRARSQASFVREA